MAESRIDAAGVAQGCTCGDCEPGCQNALCRACCGACMSPTAWKDE